jgi:hypothetical protein
LLPGLSSPINRSGKTTCTLQSTGILGNRSEKPNAK